MKADLEETGCERFDFASVRHPVALVCLLGLNCSWQQPADGADAAGADITLDISVAQSDAHVSQTTREPSHALYTPH